jgi:hypothetical protein
VVKRERRKQLDFLLEARRARQFSAAKFFDFCALTNTGG